MDSRHIIDVPTPWYHTNSTSTCPLDAHLIFINDSDVRLRLHSANWILNITSRTKWADMNAQDTMIYPSNEEAVKTQTHPQYKRQSPLFELSAVVETGQAESSFPVPKQRYYIGPKPIIPASLANTPCAKLGVDGLLKKLNDLLDTSYTLDAPPISSHLLQKISSAIGIARITSLYSLLRSCIVKNYDFGTAYAHLRPVWHAQFPTIPHKLRARKVEDQKMRRDAVDRNRIINPNVPPRRIWDLYSNRVVPWWIARQWPWGISHGWMDEKDRINLSTPINGEEWPVPIPKDVDLALIRIEMLNLGAEYVWLDVLCLRQINGRREDMRVKEWKVDVPTIGNVYVQAERVVCYFSGLGRPLSPQASDLDSDRCWFRRAWTLQEISEDPIIGGDTGGGNMQEQLRITVQKKLSLLERIQVADLFFVLSEMQNRLSTNSVDRVAGLVYLLMSEQIPAYYETQTEEEAWTALVHTMSPCYRAEMLFLYPEPGNGDETWRPLWNQVMNEKHPWTYVDGYLKGVGRDEGKNRDWYDGCCIESADVRGLSFGDSQGRLRWGEVTAADKNGMNHTFNIAARHQYPIAEGAYTMLGSLPHYEYLQYKPRKVKKQYWVVGKMVSARRFEKISVVEMDDAEQIESLRDLGVLHDFRQCGSSPVYLV